MQIFSNDAFISAAAARDYTTAMKASRPGHMLPPDSPYFGSGTKIAEQAKLTGADRVTGSGTFEQAMLQALDKVSDTQHLASELATQGIIDPDSVDIHDITLAQAQANMALNITRNVLNRLVQGWRDIINTR